MFFSTELSTWSCADGCYIDHLQAVFDPVTDEAACPRCGAAAARTGTRQAAWVSIALYRTSQSYGGPEEGGWWYTEGSRIHETLRCFEAGDLPIAWLYYQQLRESIDRNVTLKVYLEQVAPESFPTTRPHYC